MKKRGYSYLFIFFCLHAAAQQSVLDSIRIAYNTIAYKREIAYSLKNVGYIYSEDNNIKQALDYYTKSLKTYEEIKDKEGIATSLFNIGKIYNNQGDRKQALHYRAESVKIQAEVKKQQETANALNKQAYNYYKQADKTRALNYYYKSLKMYFEINDKSGFVNALNNIGTIYVAQGDKQQGMSYYNFSLKIKKESKKRGANIKLEINNPDGIAYSLNNISLIYLAQKKYELAYTYANNALIYAKETSYFKSICRAESLLSVIDEALITYTLTPETKKKELLADADVHYKQYIICRDNSGKQPIQKTDTVNKLVTATAIKNASSKNKSITPILIIVGLLIALLYFFSRRKGK
ncbi:MAG TPA: tetratricopeptide repeat protein [Bacteroidia bacterium]|jgi:tetratricopeptide (TPR) repeat protein|nr:tetratricopeptide repeat protein [Bacteroidia bacterium]